jgi:DNA primase
MFDDFSTFRDEVKNRVDIVDIVGEYVPLKKRGANYLGLCPFHTEKTPSFTVHREKQFYHCFGCGKGGDVISFLMDISGMSFIETMQHLADRLGLKMPEKRPMDTSINKEKDVILAANLAAAEHFHKTLSGNEGKQALEYLQKRGLSPETIRSFRLGYASNDSTGLLAFAKKKSLSPQDFERAGILLKSRYDTSYYNRFGGRTIFPIIDQNVRIVGFGARLLEGEGAKYINSPESVVYHKSHVLYGIHQAKDSIKKTRKAVVVEGYMDVISLHQAGITNVIASSGTAFTVEQGKTIARMANEVILLFDGDSAGLSAAARGADNLLSTDLTIGVVVLPEGHDPDSFIREKGSEALTTLLNTPQGIWEFKLSVLAKQGITVTERKKLASEIADSLSLIPDDLTRDVHIREL